MTWASEDGEPRVPRWARRWLLVIGILVAGAVLSIVVLHLVFPSRIRSQLAAIRARGEPVTSADLRDFCIHPPADEDATQLWLGAARHIQAKENRPVLKSLPFLGDGPDPALPGQAWEQFEVAQQQLANLAPEMEQLHAAGRLGGRARMPVDFTAGFNTLLTNIQELRNLARWLSLEANIRAHAGDAQGTAESLRTGLLLSQAIETEPLLVSQFVRIALHGIATRQLLRLLPAVDFSDDDLAQLGATLESLEFHSAIRRALAGERALGLTAFEVPASAGLPPAVRWAGFLTGGSDENHFLELMGDYVAASELAWPQLIAEFDDLSQAAPARLGHFDIITRLILPTLQPVWKTFARAETVNRLAIIAVALERYRRRAGHPAPNLAALVPDYLAKLPDDPTSGEPFDYRATETEYVVYSPTQLFDISKGEHVDEETGAHPLLFFRWPPRPEESKEPPSDATPDAPANAGDATEAASPSNYPPPEPRPFPDPKRGG